MNTLAPIEPTAASFLNTVVEVVWPHLPTELQAAAMAAGPAMRLQLERLALEVRDAEARCLRYAEAVRQPHFPVMAAVYFGAQDVLRDRVPAEVRAALKPLLALAAEGRLDPARQLCFVLARDRSTSEAALGRFLLWCALLLNLRIHTWDHPQPEALGVLTAMEVTAEQRLNELLDSPELGEPDFRPLHVLVLGLLEHTRCVTETLWPVLIEELGPGIQELLQTSEVLRETRRLTARDAAVLECRLLEATIGSQQLSDRHPQHYPSASAVDNQRTRVLKRLRNDEYEFVEDRLIDLLMRPEDL